ncbi:MAG: UDP-3-O-(3-hydroxymyristoyl)glucosamine N-acyltransferase [Deinococcales bacterium]
MHQQPFAKPDHPQTRAALSSRLHGELHGTDAPLGRLAAAESATPTDVVCLLRTKDKDIVARTLACAAEVLVVAQPYETTKTQIVVPDIEVAWLELLRIYRQPRRPKYIHPSASIHPSAKIGENVEIGAFVCIEADVQIGAGSIIEAHSMIGERSSLGSGCYLHERSTVRHDCHLGNGVLVQSGAVIGADGYGFHRHNGYIRQEQIGAVFIGDHVEIGATTVIDRGTLEPTRIGNGTKIGPACVVAHNCQLGENVVLIGQVGLTGSIEVGDGAILWGQTGTIGHVRIGKNAVLTACSSLSKSIPDGEVWRGAPAQPIRDELRQEAQVRRLGEYEARIKELELQLKTLVADNR